MKLTLSCMPHSSIKHSMCPSWVMLWETISWKPLHWPGWLKLVEDKGKRSWSGYLPHVEINGTSTKFWKFVETVMSICWSPTSESDMALISDRCSAQKRYLTWPYATWRWGGIEAPLDYHTERNRKITEVRMTEPRNPAVCIGRVVDVKELYVIQL